MCLMLLLRCYHPIAALQSRIRGVPRQRSSRRRLQVDKNTTNPDDKNPDKNATPSPTIVPTIIATPSPTIVPTSVPIATPSPTIVPTNVPITTDAPSSPSTDDNGDVAPVAPPVGNLTLRLYVVDDTTSASDVNEGRASDLWNGVLAGLLEVQCKSGFVMVVEQTVEGTNACATADPTRRILQREDDSVIWASAQVSVYDDEEGEQQYMDWTVVYSVLQSGANYLEDSNSQDGALVAMEADAMKALSGYIQDGSMDKNLPDTAKSYAVEPEEDADADNDDDRYSGEVKEPIDPADFHALRVAGMALLVVTVALSFVLVKIASRRKDERKLERAVTKLELGGLVTEEGLDLMLDIGRRESYKVGLSQDLGPTGEMLKSSGSDDNDLIYLPSILHPAKNDVGGNNARSLLTKGRANGDRDAKKPGYDENVLNPTKSGALSTEGNLQGEALLAKNNDSLIETFDSLSDTVDSPTALKNDSLSETFDSLSDKLDSAAGFISSLFWESPKAEDSSF